MENLNFEEMMKKNAFPEEPLDSKDRQLIQVLYGQGATGMGFNRLVASARLFASRSTVALRVKKLVRLGYLERGPNREAGRVKPIRVSFKCFGLMRSLEAVREKAKELRGGLQQVADEVPSSGDDAKNLEELYEQIRQRWNGLFGIVGMAAVLYGRAAAADLFLPLVVDQYMEMSAQHFSLLQSNPNFRSASRKVFHEMEVASAADLEAIRGDMKARLREWSEKEPEH